MTSPGLAFLTGPDALLSSFDAYRISERTVEDASWLMAVVDDLRGPEAPDLSRDERVTLERGLRDAMFEAAQEAVREAVELADEGDELRRVRS